MGIAEQQPQQQQSRPGECNLLPVLVERLRSALELSCSSRNCEDQLPLEDSGVDSEEDLRNWASGLGTSTDQNQTMTKPKLDLKFLEDLLLSDIQTALARLQDTLKRVDIGALTKYNSTLDPTNKLHLLRLISNLLAKLKIPEETENSDKERTLQRRSRSERHTIGVSTEELARARKWLEGRNLSPRSSQTTPEFDFKLSFSQNSQKTKDPKHVLENIPDKFSEDVSKNPDNISENVTETQDKFLEKTQFDQVHEKYMKDAINQQQSLQNRIREPKEDCYDLDNFLDNSTRLEDNYNDYNQVASPFYQQPSGSKYNKFLAKKSRIKRANTIDIPNYLKLQSEMNNQNGCTFLRKPIDISDKVFSNGGNVIPSFQPKTENDRKFLALINKNNDAGPPVTSVPFKNFAYSQNSVVDKNWNNRFSNIKTAFDKPNNSDNIQNCDKSENLAGNNSKPQIDNRRKSTGHNENDMMVGCLRLPYGTAKQSNGFTHAPTSPFQKIEKPSKIEPPAFLKPGYIPKGGSNLQAKVKMFDQEQTNLNPPSTLRVRTKGNHVKTAGNIFNNISHDDGKSQGITENGHLNYHSFCKQFAPKGSSILNKPSHLELAKSKFTVNDEIKDPIKKIPFVSNENGPFQKSKQKLLKMQQEENYESQKQYLQKQYDVFPVNVNSPNIPSLGYRYEQKSKSHSRHRFEAPNENRRTESGSRFSKIISEPDRSSVGVQTRTESYQEDKFRLDDMKKHPEDPIRRSNNASVQTSEFCDKHEITNTNFNYYGNEELRNRYQYEYPKPNNHFAPESRGNLETPIVPLDIRRPLETGIEPSRLPLETPRIPSELLRLPLEPPRVPGPPKSEQSAPPVPERSNYNNVLLRNYRADKTPRSKSSYYEFEENPLYVPPIPIRSNSIDKIPRFHLEEETKHSEDKFLPNSDHIQNQDISPDGVVTRYTCAIATVASVPDSPKFFDEVTKPEIPPYPNFNQTLDASKDEPQRRKDSQKSFEEVERHNLLQQNLIRRIQEQNIDKSPTRICQEVLTVPGRHALRSSTSPPFLFGNKSILKSSLEPGESGRTQEKISMFEEKNQPPVKRHFRPLNVPRADLTPPRINVVNPSKVAQIKFRNETAPVFNNISSVDSSDEYLMSCANRPSRNIVLTKSESWHQLAMSKGNLQVPLATSSSVMKPPKPKSPSSLKLSKQFEASSSSDNIKKMEERIQRYFQGPGTASVETKIDMRSKRNFHAKKNSNSLMRSHTMPHIYDEKIFDENTDVEKAFDSLFKETTRADNRY